LKIRIRNINIKRWILGSFILLLVAVAIVVPFEARASLIAPQTFIIPAFRTSLVLPGWADDPSMFGGTPIGVLPIPITAPEILAEHYFTSVAVFGMPNGIYAPGIAMVESGGTAELYLVITDETEVGTYNISVTLFDPEHGYQLLNETFSLTIAKPATPSESISTAPPAIQSGRTPSSLLHRDMFPVGSLATVDFVSHLNVRLGPGMDYNPFTHLRNGDVVTILEWNGRWIRVEFSQGEGWVYPGFISNEAVIAARAAGVSDSNAVGATDRLATQILESSTPLAQLREEWFPAGSRQTVDYAHFLNVRKGPGRSHEAFSSLARGNVVTALEYRGGWIRISTDSGYGWIFAGYLRRPGS